MTQIYKTIIQEIRIDSFSVIRKVTIKYIHVTKQVLYISTIKLDFKKSIFLPVLRERCTILWLTMCWTHNLGYEHHHKILSHCSTLKITRKLLQLTHHYKNAYVTCILLFSSQRLYNYLFLIWFNALILFCYNHKFFISKPMYTNFTAYK